MTDTLGVHYQTWKNRPAVEFALENFRKYYPTASVRMVSDAGEDFSDLAQRFGCEFVYEDINVLPRGVLSGHPASGVTDVNPIGAYHWLRRLYDTCKVLDTDWILIMEDDVLTKGIVQEFPHTHAGGIASFPFHEELFKVMYERNTTNFTWGYGMCGGTVVRREFIVYAYENHLHEFSLGELSKLDDRIYGWADILLTAFILFCNGTYSLWDGVDQVEYGLKPTAAFQHNVKNAYIEKQGSLNL
jgi:hypothetical protein